RSLRCLHGDQLWGMRCNDPDNNRDHPSAIAVSPDGWKVFITGESAGSTGHSTTPRSPTARRDASG
ncbi:MAG TPA: hypothetical protein VF972_03165, partial [Actinomycetota bacterium]